MFSSTVQATTAILTNLTANYLPKHTASGLVNSLIYDNGTNVGIGTTSPTLLFQISNRGGMSADGVFQWGDALTGNNRGTLSWDTGRAIISTPLNLDIQTNSVVRMRINNLGNVLIGTTTDSGYKLDVTGDIKSSGKIDALSIGSKFGNAIASLPALGAEGNTFGIGNGYGFRFNVLTTGDGNLQIGRFSGSATAYNLILQSQGGNVGIGQPSPAYKLDVNGTGRFTGALTASSTITATGNLLTSANLIANSGITIAQIDGTGIGLSLYSSVGLDNSTNPTYGIMFALTANKGTHGAVTGD